MHDVELSQPLAFVAAASHHGLMIVNRFDYHAVTPEQGYGVGGQLLQTGSYQAHEVALVTRILNLRRQFHGDGVIALDCGANIGIFTIEWARLMTGWGTVISIEAQERIFYALAGNIALNNCFNASAIHAAVSSGTGFMEMPILDYLKPASFGSLELRRHSQNEYIGQPIDYDKATIIKKLSIDGLALPRIDFIKLDIQRMEIEALKGAKRTMERCRPVMLIEKTDVGTTAIGACLTAGYRLLYADSENVLAVHTDDPILTSGEF